MAISFIGAASANATSVTIPTHQAGDLLVFGSFRDGSNSTPTVPGTVTPLETVTSNSAGSAWGYILAAGSGTTSGTWANATEVSVMVFRGVNAINPVGDSNPATGVSTTVSYPALSLAVTDGTSWVAAIAYHRSTDTNMGVDPTGMTNRLNLQQGADEMTAKDTNGGVASWSLQTAAVGGTSSGWSCATIEIRAASTSVTLVVADARSATTIDSVALTQKNTLVVSDARSATSLDNVALTQKNTLVVSDISAPTTIDNVDITSDTPLIVNDLTSQTTIENAALTQKNVLAIQDSSSGTTLDNVILTQKNILEVGSLSSDTTLDNVDLQQSLVLDVESLASSTSIDSVMLTQKNTLVVQDISSGTTLDGPTLVQKSTLTIADIQSMTTIDSVTITTTPMLQVQDLNINTSLDSVILTQKYLLVVADILSITTIDNVTLILPDGDVGQYEVTIYGANNRIELSQPDNSVSLYSDNAYDLFGAEANVIIRGEDYEEIISS